MAFSLLKARAFEVSLQFSPQAGVRGARNAPG